MSKTVWIGAGIAAVVLMGAGAAVRVMQLTKEGEANRAKWLPLITSTEGKYGIPAGMLDRLLYQESRYRTDIITGRKRSPVGAMGIAQFMPATAKEEMGSTAAALDPARAIPAAGAYLKKLYNLTGGDWTAAVASYNWGVGNVTRKGLAAAPKETRDYIAAIV